jgi:hypothetical protein
MASDEQESRKLQEELVQAKLAKLEALEHEIELRRRLPHRYSMKFFPWQREWFDCREKVQVLTAANQVGKSLCMMRKTIECAINQELWMQMLPESGERSKTLWYLYPTREMAMAEFNDKWRPMLPPKDDPEYGWTLIKPDKASPIVTFDHIGSSIHFKTYSQGATYLQAGSVGFLAADEELPEELIPELQSRVAATNGYMVFGFTATLGQQIWKSIVEERTMWPDAWVRQISLYDCLEYEDGSPTMWTHERIKARIDQCTTKAEVQRRVFGKFVKDEGLRFPQFDREIHLAPEHPVPKDWEVWSGVDYGSGGERGHPASIVFTAVSPDYRQARVIRSWRGDKIATTAEDIIDTWEEMKSTIHNRVVATYYDYAAADLGMIAERRGLPWMRADKSRDSGNSVLAALLKSKAIKFYIPHEGSVVPSIYLEGFKLAQELESLGQKVDKVRDKDDLCDAARYSIVKIPFAIRSGAESYTLDSAPRDTRSYAAYEARHDPKALQMWTTHDDVLDGEGEFEFWNGMLGD